MVVNTFSLNQSMRHFEEHDNVWLFGYGSLIYKADFPYLERRTARIQHWARRFWQGSHDHRGTPEHPGRVVTLIEVPGTTCEGVAYLITPNEFNLLDVREKNGYLRKVIDIQFDDGKRAEGVMYLADEGNSAFLGPACEQVIARHIAACQGPSGENSEYLLKLAQSLRELGEYDEHVFAIEQHLLELL